MTAKLWVFEPAVLFGRAAAETAAVRRFRLEQTKLLYRSDGFFGGFLKDDLPSARGARGKVLRAVVQIEKFSATAARGAFNDFVDLVLRLHRPVFIGKNVSVEVGEERK